MSLLTGIVGHDKRSLWQGFLPPEHFLVGLVYARAQVTPTPLEDMMKYTLTLPNNTPLSNSSLHDLIRDMYRLYPKTLTSSHCQPKHRTAVTVEADSEDLDATVLNLSHLDLRGFSLTFKPNDTQQGRYLKLKLSQSLLSNTEFLSGFDFISLQDVDYMLRPLEAIPSFTDCIIRDMNPVLGEFNKVMFTVRSALVDTRSTFTYCTLAETDTYPTDPDTYVPGADADWIGIPSVVTPLTSTPEVPISYFEA